MDPPISSLFNRCHKANLPKWSECMLVNSNKIEHRRLMSNVTNICVRSLIQEKWRDKRNSDTMSGIVHYLG